MRTRSGGVTRFISISSFRLFFSPPRSRRRLSSPFSCLFFVLGLLPFVCPLKSSKLSSLVGAFLFLAICIIEFSICVCKIEQNVRMAPGSVFEGTVIGAKSPDCSGAGYSGSINGGVGEQIRKNPTQRHVGANPKGSLIFNGLLSTYPNRFHPPCSPIGSLWV